MTNNQTHLDKANFDDIFLRNVILGFRSFLQDRFKWINRSEENGEYEVKLPIYYSLYGDNRYVMDSFYDDIPDKRVNMNTDQIPRGVITLNSWAVKIDEFTNPNIWFNVNVEIDDELQQIVMQTKAVPVKLSFTLTTIVDNEIDTFKMWQTYMDNMWIYKYFVFSFKRIPINGVFNFTADTTQSKIREANVGDVDVIKIDYDFEIHTFYPIFDYENKFHANKVANFIIDIWQNNQNTNLNPLTGTENL